ncbi:putative 2-aminoethylphosphonate ABC transporter permease subunit [Fusobacterium sp. IOR10]|uniref:putative 2-aminoethylphosphonate ABC transporter permease subunit n=1 Tax=Fusobacterium sp. IOR10 TaxID=2665157 RepID=UPI0013D5DC3E|nr:putative 2-aminoethylphosphonate ABC transporter permease subunit [Fusobacterium sp. IOR10]
MLINKVIKPNSLLSEKLRDLVVIIIFLFFFIGIGLPLISLISKAFHNYNNEFVGLKNFSEYLKSPNIFSSFKNTFFISIFSTSVSLILGFIYAYGISRCNLFSKRFLKLAILLPLFAPTMLHGISLVYLFGRMGLVTTGFFGHLPFLKMNINLYGPVGIIISEVMYTLPQVYLILLVSLKNSDYRLYEVSETLGGNKFKQFISVTLPSCKYAIFSSMIVSFILSFTDFGGPKVVGGNYNVLATDIFKQVVGQQNMERGAVISILLIIPALLAFFIENNISKKQRDVFNGSSTEYKVKKCVPRDIFFNVFSYLIATAIILLIITPVVTSFIKMWPYNFKLTLNNYKFFDLNGGPLSFYKNSLIIALFTSLAGTIISYLCAYISLKTEEIILIKKINNLFFIIPLALPGMVLGLSYIFFFNSQSFYLPFIGEIANPFNLIYRTIYILILVNIIHFFSVTYMTAFTGLKKLDKEFETIASSIGIPWYKTLFKVTIPLTLDTIGEIFMYYFFNTMTTVSAVIFLYTSTTTLATVAMINLNDMGDQAKAAAMGALIIGTNLFLKFIYELIKNWRKNEK